MKRDSEQIKTVSRRKFLKFTTLFSFSGMLQIFYSVKARAGGFISFAFMKKNPPLPTPFSDDVFKTYLYFGNGASQSISNGINFSGQGGMLWLKGRDAVSSHTLFDTNTGVGFRHIANASAADYSSSFTSFNSNGFTLSSVQAGELTNSSSATYVSWSFRKAAKFFDQAKVTKSAGVNTTISFSSLGTIGMVFVKRTDAAGSWYVWHRSLSTGNLIYLEQTGPATSLGHITVSGTSVNLVNGVIADGNYIVYAFAHDSATDGLIQCGSYIGNGTTGQKINLGWEPQWVMIKRISSTGDWNMFDSLRGGLVTSGSATTNMKVIYANTSGSELNETDAIYVHSQGFEFRAGSTNGVGNGSGNTFIYTAIRRANKIPSSGAQVYNAIARNGTGGTVYVTGVGFAPDLILSSARTSQNPSHYFFDRLRGPNLELYSSNTTDERSYAPSLTSFDSDGYTAGADTGSGGINYAGWPYIQYFFKRAVGFFDIVCYTGTGAAGQTVDHGLGVVPELILLKQRNGVWDWRVYLASQGNASVAYLNATNPFGASSGWNNQTPTATQIFLNGYNANAATYVAYLFASLPGISKVGTYTGSASSSVVVSCGFTGNARFVLIKRTDTTGDWIVADSVRGSSYYLTLNTTTAEVSGTVLTFTTGGFTTATSGSITNISGASYLYLAIS